MQKLDNLTFLKFVLTSSLIFRLDYPAMGLKLDFRSRQLHRLGTIENFRRGEKGPRLKAQIGRNHNLLLIRA